MKKRERNASSATRASSGSLIVRVLARQRRQLHRSSQSKQVNAKMSSPHIVFMFSGVEGGGGRGYSRRGGVGDARRRVRTVDEVFGLPLSLLSPSLSHLTSARASDESDVRRLLSCTSESALAGVGPVGREGRLPPVAEMTSCLACM